MANFDFKAATPDTSFPSGGFLMGADSQSAADPSLYSDTAYRNYILSLAGTWLATQTITPAANTNALAVTGYSLTGSNASSLMDLAGTWNTTGVASGLKINITNTASGIGSKILDIQSNSESAFAIFKSNDKFAMFENNYVLLVGTGTRLTGNRQIQLSGSLGVHVGSGVSFAFSSSSDVPGGAADTISVRDAANVWAHRNGTTAQTLRVYSTWTDSSNYERGALNAGSDYIELAAETAGTGDDNLDVRLTPAGTGNVRFGTHSGVAAELVTGYITIKDSGGTSRKIAVIS